MTRPLNPENPCGVYVHFPFCGIRCTYCDFATYAGRERDRAAYLSALREEIRTGQTDLPREVDTVFVGGGTPSRMTGPEFASVLDAVRARFALRPGAEITLEANPEDVEPDRLDAFLAAGMTRLSIGVQSLDDRVLESVGRAHDGCRALEALRTARKAGVPEVGADLISGLPREQLSRWTETLERVVDEAPDHLSVYLLETDKDSPLARSIRAGLTQPEADEVLVDAYQGTVAFLERCGFEQYEISNFARNGRRSRHNMKYWTDQPYGGFGLGAHGYAAGARRWNRKGLRAYIDCVARGADPVEGSDPWSPVRRLEEALMMGLRLNEGIDLVTMSARYGVDVERGFLKVWSLGTERGWLRAENGRLRLTDQGRVWSNEVFRAVLGGLEPSPAAGEPS